MSNKLYVRLKFSLIFMLVTLIIYILFTSYKLTSKPYLPRNALEVSPLTGKSLMSVNSDNIIYNVEYSTSNIFDLYRIYDNDIVYESYNKKTDSLHYKASSVKNIGSHETVRHLESNNYIEFPNLSFINYSDMKKYNFENDESDVFIEYGPFTSTSFIYTRGQYKYINSVTQEDKHIDTNEPITFTNIIVQFIDNNSPDVGDGFLFTGGKHKELTWNNTEFYFKDTKIPITLNRGNSIWIKLDINDKSKVIYN